LGDRREQGIPKRYVRGFCWDGRRGREQRTRGVLGYIAISERLRVTGRGEEGESLALQNDCSCVCVYKRGA
jgi:hypothetical protein